MSRIREGGMGGLDVALVFLGGSPILFWATSTEF